MADRLQRRNQLASLAEDRYTGDPYLYGTLRQVLSYPEIVEVVEEIITIQSRNGCNCQQIEAQLIEHLSGFVLIRGDKTYAAGKGMIDILRQLAPVVAAYIQLTRDGKRS